jgi:hypothetical protein
MPIPQRVRDSAAEADQALADLSKSIGQPAPDASQEPTPPSTAATQTSAPQDNGARVVSIHEGRQGSDTEELARQLAEANQRNASLQGMFNRSEAQLGEMRQQIDSMRQLIELQAAQRTTAPQDEPVSLLSDKEKDEFGEDLLEAARKAAREQWEPQLRAMMRKAEQLEAKLSTLEQQLQQVGSVAGRTSQMTWEQRVMSEIPNFNKKNVDPGFLRWLEEADPLSGYKRGQLLSAAAQVQDIARVKTFFETYFGPKSSEAPSGADEGNGRIDPATLVAPGEAAAPQQSTAPTKGKVWTMAEIDDIYARKRRNRISDADFAKAERDIQAAAVEGRIKTT